MPLLIYNILFEKKFDDISARHRLTTDTVVLTDVERREVFLNKINTILSKKFKKKNHLLPPIIPAQTSTVVNDRIRRNTTVYM